MPQHRFQDQHHRLSDFEKEVWVVCPNCAKQTIAQLQEEIKEARLNCKHCGYIKQKSTLVHYQEGKFAELKQAAHAYFEVELWLKAPFKKDMFWAYNPAHLAYLEQCISAKLREHKDRTHFTLLEKLPKFYHDAKNREVLLKIIKKLKTG
jgi:predicted RNA-binding Zn-ribbon protein involved in translation (DUF1610 family)